MHSTDDAVGRGAPKHEGETGSEYYLDLLTQTSEIQAKRIASVGTVLVVFSAKAMAYDSESLRQKILIAYPDAAVFFRTTSGKELGVTAPQKVDLLVDLTGPGQRQKFCYSKKLRKMAKFTVGRNAGFFRKRIYDRIYDEKAQMNLPKDMIDRERWIQREVLALAGIPMVPAGNSPADRGLSIALELPPLRKN